VRTTPRPLEKHVEADIIRALRAMGFAVTKTSQPRPSMLTRGVPDLYAAHPRWGLRAWIEVKRPGEKPSPDQVAWHRCERLAGGTVLVADSVAAVVEALKKMGAPLG
jgi:hypothetical protein